MDGGRAAGGRARGGEDVQALRRIPPRLIAAGAALAAAAALGAYATLLAGRYEWAPLAAVAAGAALLVLALALDLAGAVPLALTLFAGAYAGALLLHGSALDPYAPLVAGGLLLCGELALLSLDLRGRAAEPARVRLRRVALLGGLVALGTLAAAFVLLASAPALGGGAAWEAAGAAAAVLALAAVARLARQV